MNTTLRENIDWVGAIDWNIRDFHGYDTERGSSYNAYLVRDEKTALIDAVKAPFAAELLRNVAALQRPVAGGLRRLQPRRAGPRRRVARGASGDAQRHAGLR